MVRALACHARGRGFEPRCSRFFHFFGFYKYDNYMQNIQKRTLLILLAYGLFGASDTKQKTPFKFNQFNNYWIGNDILTSNEMTRNEAIKLIDGLLDVNIDILDEMIGPYNKNNKNNKNNKILIQNIKKRKKSSSICLVFKKIAHNR